MKIEEGNKLLKSFIEKSDAEKHPYFLCHFSKEENRFEGFHEHMDILDAMIVIKNLVREFNIESMLLATAIQKPKTSEPTVVSI